MSDEHLNRRSENDVNEKNKKSNGLTNEKIKKKPRVGKLKVYAAMGASSCAFGFAVHGVSSLIFVGVGVFCLAKALCIDLENLAFKHKSARNWSFVILGIGLLGIWVLWREYRQQSSTLIKPQASFALGVQIGQDVQTVVFITNTFKIETKGIHKTLSNDVLLIVPISAGQTNVPFVFLIKNTSLIDADSVSVIFSVPEETPCVAPSGGWMVSDLGIFFKYEHSTNNPGYSKSGTWKTPAILAGDTEETPILMFSTLATSVRWLPISILIKAKETTAIFAAFQVCFTEVPTNVSKKPFFERVEVNANGFEVARPDLK